MQCLSRWLHEDMKIAPFPVGSHTSNTHDTLLYSKQTTTLDLRLPVRGSRNWS
jgi:hypothetical protein